MRQRRTDGATAAAVVLLALVVVILLRAPAVATRLAKGEVDAGGNRICRDAAGQRIYDCDKDPAKAVDAQGNPDPFGIAPPDSPAAELRRAQGRPAVRTLAARDGYDPIVTYDPADKRLTVTEHTAADVLLCITYGQLAEPVCKLPAEWVGR